MTNPLDSKVSYLERVKIQSQVPVLNHLRSQLGDERANGLVYGTLRNWSREVFTEVGAGKSVHREDHNEGQQAR